MEKRKVFTIMPFEDRFFKVFEMLKRQFENEFEFSHAGTEDNQQNILNDIVKAILEADIIIANLTGLNPNVFYELGIAHTLNKKVIIITEDLVTLPFDLKSYRAKEYSTHFVKFQELVDSLETYLKGAVTGDIIYSNPVNDFMVSNNLSITKLLDQNSIPASFDNKLEKGFIDFMAEIEENASELSSNIIDMTADLQTMTLNMNNSTQEIERVNKTGGGGTTSFVRKETKKVAGYISDFSHQLRVYNKRYTELWDKIEKDTLGLLENKFAKEEGNRDNLSSFLKSLHEMQSVIKNNSDPIVNLRLTFEKSLGLERTLNQAIKFVNDDLNNYLSIMEQITLSIDRIKEKSRFIIGDIDYSI